MEIILLIEAEYDKWEYQQFDEHTMGRKKCICVINYQSQ